MPEPKDPYEDSHYIKPKDDATFLLNKKIEEEKGKHPERFEKNETDKKPS